MKLLFKFHGGTHTGVGRAHAPCTQGTTAAPATSCSSQVMDLTRNDPAVGGISPGVGTRAAVLPFRCGSPPTDGDQGDVRAAREGDRDAFERLYHRHVGRVHGLCRRLAGDAIAAEELTQDAFVRAWQKLDLFREESAFSTWLYRLTANVVLADHRARGRRLRDLVPLDALHLLSPARRGERLDLDGAIAALPARARWVFVLHEIEGYDHDEIATMTGMSPSTARVHLHRARKALREALGR